MFLNVPFISNLEFIPVENRTKTVKRHMLDNHRFIIREQNVVPLILNQKNNPTHVFYDGNFYEKVNLSTINNMRSNIDLLQLNPEDSFYTLYKDSFNKSILNSAKRRIETAKVINDKEIKTVVFDERLERIDLIQKELDSNFISDGKNIYQKSLPPYITKNNELDLFEKYKTRQTIPDNLMCLFPHPDMENTEIDYELYLEKLAKINEHLAFYLFSRYIIEYCDSGKYYTPLKNPLLEMDSNLLFELISFYKEVDNNKEKLLKPEVYGYYECENLKEKFDKNIIKMMEIKNNLKKESNLHKLIEFKKDWEEFLDLTHKNKFTI